MKARDERCVDAADDERDDQERRYRGAGAGQGSLNEADLMSLFQKMIKQREETADSTRRGGRAELAAQENGEIAIITSYLPQQMSDVEAGAAILRGASGSSTPRP